MIKAKGEQVIVEVEVTTISTGGIIIPEGSNAKMKIGRVLNHGEQVKNIKNLEIVLFNSFGATKINPNDLKKYVDLNIDNAEYYIMPAIEVLAGITKED